MIAVKGSGGHIITITSKNLEVFDFLGDKIILVQNNKPRIANNNLILMTYGEHK